MNVTKEQFEGLYVGQKLTISECSEKLGISRSIVHRRLLKFGIKTRSPWDRSEKITKRELEDLYIGQNLSIKQCAKVLGYSPTNISYYLRKLGIKSRPKGRFDHRIPGITKDRLENLYVEQGLSVRKCAEALGIPTHGAVVERLHEFGIKCRPARFRIGDKTNKGKCGEKAGGWKGGKKVITCTQCGKKLFRFPALIRENNFCNFVCHGEFLSEHTNGKENPNYGNSILAGEKNPNWKGGLSQEPYPIVWGNFHFKDDIKKRDNYTCQNPDCRRNAEQLTIHHIDYDKKNCDPKNLITLCTGCNGRANFNREFWEAGYREIIRLNYEMDYQQIAI